MRRGKKNTAFLCGKHETLALGILKNLLKIPRVTKA